MKPPATPGNAPDGHSADSILHHLQALYVSAVLRRSDYPGDLALLPIPTWRAGTAARGTAIYSGNEKVGAVAGAASVVVLGSVLLFWWAIFSARNSKAA